MSVLDIELQREVARQDALHGKPTQGPMVMAVVLAEEVGEFSEMALQVEGWNTNGRGLSEEEAWRQARCEALQIAACAYRIARDCRRPA